jgi:hypothetical protein
MLFSEWLFFLENIESHREDFKKIVKGVFPEAAFFGNDKNTFLWSNIDFQDGRRLKLTWEPGMTRFKQAKPDYKDRFSSVYISFENKDGSWESSKELRPGSLDFSRKLKVLVTNLTNVGITVEYIPSDSKRSRYFSMMMDRLGIKRVGHSNYWMKNPPQLPPQQPPAAQPQIGTGKW